MELFYGASNTCIISHWNIKELSFKLEVVTSFYDNFGMFGKLLLYFPEIISWGIYTIVQNTH